MNSLLNRLHKSLIESRIKNWTPVLCKENIQEYLYLTKGKPLHVLINPTGFLYKRLLEQNLNIFSFVESRYKGKGLVVDFNFRPDLISQECASHLPFPASLPFPLVLYLKDYGISKENLGWALDLDRLPSL